MFYIVGKVKGDVSGYWDESHDVIKHCEEITQEIIDEHSDGVRLTKVLENRWVEVWLDGNSPYYDCMIFFNDSIPSKQTLFKLNGFDGDEDLEKCIYEYRSTIRNERIDKILN